MGWNNHGFQMGQTALIELSLSSSQTAATGQIVLFDTIRASHTHSVSVDASGNISLSTSKAYWMQASIDVSRSSTTSSWQFGFCDSSGTVIAPADGGFDAEWQYHSPTVDDDQPNATFTATYVSSSPLSSVNLKALNLAALSTILVGTRVLIIEQELS